MLSGASTLVPPFFGKFSFTFEYLMIQYFYRDSLSIHVSTSFAVRSFIVDIVNHFHHTVSNLGS